MPCKHAVAVINEMATTNADVGLPESWVHSSYWVKTWAKQYSHTINPLNGKNLWIKHPSPYTIIPPKIHPQIGRPPKSRKKVQVRYLPRRCLKMVNCQGLVNLSNVVNVGIEVTIKQHAAKMLGVLKVQMLGDLKVQRLGDHRQQKEQEEVKLEHLLQQKDPS